MCSILGPFSCACSNAEGLCPYELICAPTYHPKDCKSARNTLYLLALYTINCTIWLFGMLGITSQEMNVLEIVLCGFSAILEDEKHVQ